MPKPFVVDPTGGWPLDLGTFEAVVLASGDQTDDAFSLLRTQRELPGFGPRCTSTMTPPRPSTCWGASTGCSFRTASTTADRDPSCTCHAASPTPFQVTSETPGKKLNIFAPHAMVGFFEALAAADGEVTPKQLAAIAADHHMEVVGPVPGTYL
jgi:hypothetical protein